MALISLNIGFGQVLRSLIRGPEVEEGSSAPAGLENLTAEQPEVSLADLLDQAADTAQWKQAYIEGCSRMVNMAAMGSSRASRSFKERIGKADELLAGFKGLPRPPNYPLLL